MNIKITEGPKGWTLWVTEKPGDDQPPIYTATGRTAEQIAALLPVVMTAMEPAPAAEKPGSISMAKVARSQALYAMFGVLDSWIGGAQENHDALGHRGESRGAECWRTFAPSDIRNMINDAARELGISEFPIPSGGKEDAR